MNINYEKCFTECDTRGYDINNKETYDIHANFIKEIGDFILTKENRLFVIDEWNKKILKFLLYYFNGSELCENIFPEENFNANKNILLIGNVGCGKTILMQIFEFYTKRMRLQTAFRNIGITELVNHQKTYSNINMYTYNYENEKVNNYKPHSFCLHDYGVLSANQKSYGTDMNHVIEEFMLSRYEIWQNKGVKFHLTTNLTTTQIKASVEPRIYDRFKAFNIINIIGGSRRE